MNLVSRIDAVLYSKKTITTTPSSVSFFDSVIDSNLTSPNSLPANWRKFTIDTIKLFVNKLVNNSTNLLGEFLANSYFEFKISNYLILSSNLTKLVDFGYNLQLAPTSTANVYEISTGKSFSDKNHLKLEKPIVLEPNLTFTFTIYFRTFLTEFNNADIYLVFRGILEKEIVG